MLFCKLKRIKWNCLQKKKDRIRDVLTELNAKNNPSKITLHYVIFCNFYFHSISLGCICSISVDSEITFLLPKVIADLEIASVKRIELIIINLRKYPKYKQVNNKKLPMNNEFTGTCATFPFDSIARWFHVDLW